jgi:hypothetical protein
MEEYLKSPVAAQRLGVSYHRLVSLLRYRKIDLPAKDSSGDFVWSEKDLQAAREALENGRQRRAAV